MVRFGVHVGQQNCTISELRDAWARAEHLGVDWISIWDHFYASQIDESRSCFEAVACHAALASLTGRVRVGCLVYCAEYRHPAVLANAAVTIDHLSDGRLELGVGAGWHESEFRAYGIPFEPPATRLRRVREYVTILRSLFTEPIVTFAGEFWNLNEAICSPKPLQQPSPRIWIGAAGPKALAQAGAIGDGWNAAFLSPDSFARSRSWVLEHAPEPDSYQSSINLALIPEGMEPLRYLEPRFGPAAPHIAEGSLRGSSEELTDQVGKYVDAGADWVIIAARAPFDHGTLERFASDVIPHFRARRSPGA